MDINQSALSRYKSNKSSSSMSKAEAKAIAEALRHKDAAASSLQYQKSPELKDGQIIKGQIVDHRYNEVSIRLEPEQQIIKAKLAGDVPLSIGQEAQFMVNEDGSKQLILKYIPDTSAVPVDATVQKALAASNYPMTECNKAIVTELLNHRLPVDKQTLQQLIKASHMNREASPLTLVLMLKNKLPLTPSNVRQFEAYQKGSNQLISDIRAISNKLSEMIRQAGSDTQAYTESLPREEASIGQSTNMTEALENALSPVATEEDQASGVQVSRPLNSEQPSVIEQSSINEARKDPRLHNINEALRMNHSLLEILLNRDEEAASAGAASAGSPDFIADGTAQGQSSRLPGEDGIPSLSPLSLLLTPKERLALLEEMAAFPDIAAMKNEIEDGSVSIQKLLRYIQDNIQKAGTDGAEKLLQSPIYEGLLEEAFRNKWTLTPEKIAKKKPVAELYRDLQEDMEEISRLMKLSNKGREADELFGPVKNLRENISFMKDLNEAFTYLQLPFQINHRDQHSELYVLSRKRAPEGNKEKLSVLLHLDMPHIGPINIHLQLNNKHIYSKFYLSSEDTAHLIGQHLPQLSTALEQKGYYFHSELEAVYQKPDFISDFIERNASEYEIKNYTFDIRT